MIDVLFICKKRQLVDGEPGCYAVNTASGLRNSVSFVAGMLRSMGVKTVAVDVHDNNCIDREVTKWRPKQVIIEALWVVPEKFHILKRLHPTVTWTVRLHSETPFLANEGMAMRWIGEYLRRGVQVSANSDRLLKELRETFWEHEDMILYQPNFYPINDEPIKRWEPSRGILNISCFGAVRPLKNHLMQALAAIKFARQKGRYLAFHINAGRYEGKGEPVRHNLQGLFDHMPDAQLVEWQWMPHEAFKQVAGSMDLGMQVSFTETFNIVTADQVDAGVPVVTSPEVRWVNTLFHADPTSYESMVRAMNRAWALRWGAAQFLNLAGLESSNRATRKAWHDWVGTFVPTWPRRLRPDWEGVTWTST
jgi:hypothetical protein